MFPDASLRLRSRIGSLDFSMLSSGVFVTFVTRFLSSHKITTKNRETKRNGLEKCGFSRFAYCSDFEVSFSFSLRIVSILFLVPFFASLADAVWKGG